MKPTNQKWETDLLKLSKELADNLQVYGNKRYCHICGASPENQAEWIINLVKEEKQISKEEGRQEVVEEVEKMIGKNTHGAIEHDSIILEEEKNSFKSELRQQIKLLVKSNK